MSNLGKNKSYIHIFFVINNTSGKVVVFFNYVLFQIQQNLGKKKIYIYVVYVILVHFKVFSID